MVPHGRKVKAVTHDRAPTRIISSADFSLLAPLSLSPKIPFAAPLTCTKSALPPANRRPQSLARPHLALLYPFSTFVLLDRPGMKRTAPFQCQAAVASFLRRAPLRPPPPPPSLMHHRLLLPARCHSAALRLAARSCRRFGP
jgi:hypothetical protein